jgi:hypothetical protein
MINPRKWLGDRGAALTLAALALPGLAALWIGVQIHLETRAAAEAARTGFARLMAAEDLQGRTQAARALGTVSTKRWRDCKWRCKACAI